MTYVYLDANVYADAERGEIPSEDTEAFHAARERGDIVPRLSVVDLEESLGLWEKDRPAAIKRLQIARSLVGFDNLLKPPGDLLIEAIEGYAMGAGPVSPLMPRQQRRHGASKLGKIADRSAALDGVVRQVVADVKALKEKFRT